MRLFRPVGLEELLLIHATRMRAFPLRLVDQPIFYPVLNESYAIEIARDWNTKSRTLAGYVTQFSIDDAYAATFPVQVAGARTHQELWVPAESLDEFNANIDGRIEVVHAFFGEGFTGSHGPKFLRQRTTPIDLLHDLATAFAQHASSFEDMVRANEPAIFAYISYWTTRSFDAHGIVDARRDEVLRAIRACWPRCSSHAPLPAC